MNKTQIKAEIVAHSLSPQGDELISILATFPRIILAEVNTHRMLSKNTSSSRAIPFLKMIEAVKTNPFIPMAWQKNHSGMQGTEYLPQDKKFNLIEFITALEDTLKAMGTVSEDYLKTQKQLEEKVNIIKTLLSDYTLLEKTLNEWWLFARDKAIEAASIMYVFDVTKQLCNRLLEPFMWTTMLITGPKSGWDNFFNLRCPVYQLPNKEETFKSWKELTNYYEEKYHDFWTGLHLENYTQVERLKCNKGQAEIHMMELAEAIYDAVNESAPKELKAGEWHIPFENKMDITSEDYIKILGKVKLDFRDLIKIRVKSSVAMAARTSYTVVGDEKEVNYENLIALHDRLLIQYPPHSSPMEHCARAMTEGEYESYYKGFGANKNHTGILENQGWCYNLKGFISYRYMIDNNLLPL